MSTPADDTPYRCPIRTEFGRFCPRMHYPQVGELNPPGIAELDLNAVLSRINPADAVLSTAKAAVKPETPAALEPAPITNVASQPVWDRLSAALRVLPTL